jgi:hypothetical protein
MERLGRLKKDLRFVIEALLVFTSARFYFLVEFFLNDAACPRETQWHRAVHYKSVRAQSLHTSGFPCLPDRQAFPSLADASAKFLFYFIGFYFKQKSCARPAILVCFMQRVL